MSSSVLLEYARQYYYWYWIAICLFTLLLVLLPNKKSKKLNLIFPLLLSIVVVLFITFRPPVSRYFGDTGTYMRGFLASAYRDFDFEAKDIGHEFLMQLLKGCNVELLFLVYAVIYVGGHLLTAKKLFPSFCAVALIVMIGSFSFFGYGFNGMRNGAACALVMLAFIERRMVFQIALFLFAASLHKSVLLPIGAYYLVNYFKDTKLYLKVWFLCIIVNVLIPNCLGELSWLTDMIEDERSSYLTTDFDSFEYDVAFSHTGFRWDFLFFSAVPVYFGWETLMKGKMQHSLYSLFFNVYLVCNSAWLFTARLPYNNRIAYLSWFLMPILLFFPFALSPKYSTNTNINLLMLMNLSLCFII